MKNRKASMTIERKVHDEYVIPVKVYGSETWALKKAAHMELLSVAQRKIERIMLGITLRDHKRNTWIRYQTGVNDTIDVNKKEIRGRAGHIAQFKENRRKKGVTEWTPGPVFMSVGITYDGHISKPGITELKVGSSENWYSRVR